MCRPASRLPSVHRSARSSIDGPVHSSRHCMGTMCCALLLAPCGGPNPVHPLLPTNCGPRIGNWAGPHRQAALQMMPTLFSERLGRPAAAVTRRSSRIEPSRSHAAKPAAAPAAVAAGGRRRSGAGMKRHASDRRACGARRGAGTAQRVQAASMPDGPQQQQQQQQQLQQQRGIEAEILSLALPTLATLAADPVSTAAACRTLPCMLGAAAA